MAGTSKRTASPMVFVKNGVTSAKHDRMMAAKKADTDRRRAADDQRFQMAKKKVWTDAEGNSNVSTMKQHSLGGTKTHASVVLGLRHPKDFEVMDWMVCELTMQETQDGKPDMMLVMCCPRCVFKYDRDPGESQMHIRQSNRMFYLDQRSQQERKPNPILKFCAGDFWVNPKNKSEVVTIAGMVTCEEKSKCPVCGWSFKIDDSVIHTLS